MKKYIFSFLFLIASIQTFGQNIDRPTSFISFHFGLNKHGTGDMSGYSYGTNYEIFLGNKWFVNIGFEGTLNDDKGLAFIWKDPADGYSYNSTLHYVTGGFQLLIGGGFNFINNRNHRFGINPNIFGRFQVTSLNDVESILYPPLTGFPVPIKFIYNTTPSRTFAFGGALKLFYDYKFNNNYTIGLMGGFQIDTNGDTIRYAAIRLGKYF